MELPFTYVHILVIPILAKLMIDQLNVTLI